MQANDVRCVANLRGSLHYLLVKMEAERKALIAKLVAVRKQAVTLLQRVHKLAVPVDEVVPERPCSHRKYRQLRKLLAPKPAPVGLFLLSAPAEPVQPAISEADPEVAKATAALKAKRALLMAAQKVPVHA